MFDPITPQGKDISSLFILVLVLGAIVYTLVCGLLIFGMIRGRRRARREGDPRQISGNNRLEFAWTAAPAVLLIALYIPTVMVINSADPAATASKEIKDKPDIVVIGHQWWWEYQYTDSKVVTANELHLLEGKRVLVHLKSADVQHDFWVPELGRKIDIYPDHDNFLYLEPQRLGNYIGACAEYCGAEHAWMRINVIVQNQTDYDNWIKSQQAPHAVAAAPANPVGGDNGDPVRGQQVFLNNTCINCHAIAGTTATSTIAPNLTHLGSRATLGTGVIDNNPANLARWILDPNKIKPGLHMPGYQLSQEDLRDLVAYLEEQK